MLTIQAALLHRSAQNMDHQFLSDGRHLAFRTSDVLRLNRSTAARLDAHEITRSGRVAIILPDGIRLSLAILEVASHCTEAPLNPKASEDALAEWLDDLKPDGVLTGPGTPDHSVTVAHRMGLPVVGFDVSDMQSAGEEAGPWHTPAPEDIALILHKSGTTAKARKVPLTHANLMSSAGNVARTLGLARKTCD